MDWRMQAACRHADPHSIFLEGTAGPALLAIAAAKQICFACRPSGGRGAGVGLKTIESFRTHGTQPTAATAGGPR